MRRRRAKSPRPDHEEQQVADAAKLPCDIKEEETEGTTLQAPAPEQHLLTASVLNETVPAASTTTTTKMTFYLRINNWIWGKKVLE